MPRTAKDYDTRTKTARAKLEPRRKPYYRQIGPGKTLGYFRRENAAGAWEIRESVGGNHFKHRALGLADDIARADGRDILTYEQAMRAASNPQGAAPVGKLTVAAALDAYLTRLAARSKHADHYRAISAKHIAPALGHHRVDRLTKTQIETWLAGLVADDPDDPDASAQVAGHGEPGADDPQGRAQRRISKTRRTTSPPMPHGAALSRFTMSAAPEMMISTPGRYGS